MACDMDGLGMACSHVMCVFILWEFPSSSILPNRPSGCAIAVSGASSSFMPEIRMACDI